MEIKVTSNIKAETQKIINALSHREAFVKTWAMSAAINARKTAWAKPGRRWWKDLSRSIQVRKTSANSAEVTSAKRGANQKQYGGDIYPTKKKYLTIPFPEAGDKSAYEWETPTRQLFVAPGTQVLGYSEGEKFHGLFFLARHVHQDPSPWFPKEAELFMLANREASRMFAKEQRSCNM
ncbi:MAG: hypothetical protein WCS73_12270 [Lentisphaeria bacterium]